MDRRIEWTTLFGGAWDGGVRSMASGDDLPRSMGSNRVPEGRPIVANLEFCCQQQPDMRHATCDRSKVEVHLAPASGGDAVGGM